MPTAQFLVQWVWGRSLEPASPEGSLVSLTLRIQGLFFENPVFSSPQLTLNTGGGLVPDTAAAIPNGIAATILTSYPRPHSHQQSLPIGQAYHGAFPTAGLIEPHVLFPFLQVMGPKLHEVQDLVKRNRGDAAWPH